MEQSNDLYIFKKNIKKIVFLDCAIKVIGFTNFISPEFYYRNS